MSKNKKLYSDDHPETTISGTGYQNEAAVEKTIKLIKNRSIKYQQAVMTTMYYRAKHHPHQTPEMQQAMKLIKKWLRDHRSYQRAYDYLNLDLINQYEKLADIYDISHVARGLKPATRSDKGFLEIYRELNGNFGKLAFIPVFKTKPRGPDYEIAREHFINARLGQMRRSRTPLYYTSGKYQNLPTRQHVVLIMNGYSPDKKGLVQRLPLIKKLKK